MLSKSLESFSLDNITAQTQIASLLVASSSHILAAFEKDKEVTFLKNGLIEPTN